MNYIIFNSFSGMFFPSFFLVCLPWPGQRYGKTLGAMMGGGPGPCLSRATDGCLEDGAEGPAALFGGWQVALGISWNILEW